MSTTAPTATLQTEEQLQRHVEKNPGDAAAWIALAEHAARRGDFDSAVWALAAASRLQPANAGILNNLALVQLLAGRPEDGLRAAERAVALDPRHPHAWAHVGQARGDLGRYAEAEAAYREAVKLSPDSGEAWFGLAASLAHQGQWTAAREAYTGAALRATGSADPWLGRANAELRIGLRRDAVETLMNARDVDPARAAAVESAALFAMQYGDEFTPAQVFEAHQAWAARHVPPANASTLPGRAVEKVRVGFVSSAFHRSAMAFALEPLLQHIDRDKFLVCCYSQTDGEDEVSERLWRLVDGHMDTRLRSDAEFALSVRDDRIEVLVDLSGHTPGNRLTAFGLRLARAQVSWLDYFNTTGVPAMDALLVDDGAMQGLDQRFVEKLVSLGPVRYPYLPPSDSPSLGRGPGGGSLTFASYGRLAKVCATTLDAWCAAMNAVPESRLVLKNDAAPDPHVREGLGQEFSKRGVDPSRIEWRPPSPHGEMLAQYADVDIVLDTVPYNGGITSLEALWMGRPVVTIAGATLVGRQGASILGAIGRPQWVARDREGFAAIVKGLAGDRTALSREQASLREAVKRSPFCDYAGFARRFEAIVESLAAR